MEENKFEQLQGGLLDSLDEMLGSKTSGSENTDKLSSENAANKTDAKEESVSDPSISQQPQKEEKVENKERQEDL